MQNKQQAIGLIKQLGPGLLYAGAAIGVSHVVQSTRAGAEFGYQLIIAIIFIHFIKYPFFKFGPAYATATGNHLIHGYAKLGKWAVFAFITYTLCTMFIVQSAVTPVTAGIASQLFGVDIKITACCILGICATLLLVGRFQLLDKLMKIIIVVLAITSLVTCFLAFWDEGSIEHQQLFSFRNEYHVVFLIALLGWMPAPLDISVWHSVWTVKKQQDVNSNMRAATLDFNLGFWGTALLAICFLLLGAITFHEQQTPLSESGTAFAGQLITMYTDKLGKGMLALIATAVLTTMFSTTLTCLDAFPRVLSPSFKLLHKAKWMSHYTCWLLITTVGSCIVLLFLTGSNFFTRIKRSK